MNTPAVDAVARLTRGIVEQGLEPLRAALLSEPPPMPLRPQRGDYDLNPGLRSGEARDLVPAAVLLPIVRRSEPTVLFTRRSAHLARHAGQVSFPGGRVHAEDISLVETALRETQEETGISASYIAIAGFLESYETGTGFAILPVIGLLSEGFSLFPSIEEVVEIFEVPLAFLLNPANRHRQAREWNGKRREFHAFAYDGHCIWGATAAILVILAERLSAP